MKNTLFTMKNCSHCVEAREYLDGCQAPYREFDVEDSRAALETLIRLTGRMEVPALLAGYEAVIGFNAVTWEAALAHTRAISAEDPYLLPEALGEDPYEA
jgi:glutaredoxin